MYDDLACEARRRESEAKSQRVAEGIVMRVGLKSAEKLNGQDVIRVQGTHVMQLESDDYRKVSTK